MILFFVTVQVYQWGMSAALARTHSTAEVTVSFLDIHLSATADSTEMILNTMGYAFFIPWIVIFIVVGRMWRVIPALRPARSDER